MLTWVYNRFGKLPMVFTKGFISVTIGFLIFQQMWFGSDEAAKYLDPKPLWYLNWMIGSIAIIFNSIQQYLSKTYSDHLEEKKKQNGDTVIITKP